MTPHEDSELAASDLQRLCDLLYDRTGLLYGERKRYFIERRVVDRMYAAGTDLFADYFALIRADSRELMALINAFTINETYFYREDHQLSCLSRSILPEIVKTKGPGDKIRIWSAACSTGEEPYSVAIWLLENWPMVDAYNVEIIGSDIDTEALAAAVAGRYSKRALSRLPEELVRRYFEPAVRGHWRIIRDLQESVAFTPVNLIDLTSMRAQGQFEVVFCRNVLIYFDDASRAVAMDNLYNALRPGGFICLGHSESMTRMSDRFIVRRFPDAVVYQRPEAPP